MGYIIKRSVEQTKASKKRLLVYLVLGALCLAASLIPVFVNPITMISRYMGRIDNGTLVHAALAAETDSIHISAYLFNITNLDQFLSGEDNKLKVQQIGPFTYQENRTQEGLEIDKEAGVIRYTPRHKVTFIPEESVADPKDVFVTVPNVAMLSMGSAVSEYGYLAKMGFNMLTARLGSNATVSMSAYDYLWGYDEPLIRLGNQVMSSRINFDSLGLMDRLYDKKSILRLEVSARDEDKFMIKTVNGQSGLTHWGYPDKNNSCNSYLNAFEGLAYPPEMDPHRPLKLYRNVFCRFLEMEYQGLKTMDYGVAGMVYKFTNTSYSKIPENECLCEKGICYDGVSDLSPCFNGLPVVMSNAHYMDANPKIYERLEGMNPNEEEHGSEIIIDPVIGLAMATKLSIQVSVLVRDVGFNQQIEKFSDMLVPAIYFKIMQPKLPDEKITVLKLVHIYLPKIVLVLQVVLMLVGLVFLTVAAQMFYCNWILARRRGIAYRTDVEVVKEILSNEPLMIRS